MSGRSLRSSNSPSRARSRSLQHVRKEHPIHLSTYSGRPACLRSQVGQGMLLRELRARLVSFERLRQ